VQAISQFFDFSSEVRNALLAAALLIIPLCAQMIAAYIRLHLNCLREQIEDNTRLTQQTLHEIQQHNENCTGPQPESEAQEF
jgi:hypothetical protein